jgi:hypothetical protein
MTELKTWSYSSATTFEKCPKQYYHLYVAKDIKQDPNVEHFLYGNEVHKAAELYVSKQPHCQKSLICLSQRLIG